MDLPIGTIVAFGGDFNDANKDRLERSGWLPCDGKSYDIHEGGDPTRPSKFHDLFQVIRSNFGAGYEEPRPGQAKDAAENTGNFNVPDLRGRFLRGADLGSGRDPLDRTSMRHGGSGHDVGSVQHQAIQPHGHVGQRLFASVPRAVGPELASGLAPGGAFGDNNAGGITRISEQPGGGPETRPINAAVNWIIKYRSGN